MKARRRVHRMRESSHGMSSAGGLIRCWWDSQDHSYLRPAAADVQPVCTTVRRQTGERACAGDSAPPGVHRGLVVDRIARGVRAVLALQRLNVMHERVQNDLLLSVAVSAARPPCGTSPRLQVKRRRLTQEGEQTGAQRWPRGGLGAGGSRRSSSSNRSSALR